MIHYEEALYQVYGPLTDVMQSFIVLLVGVSLQIVLEFISFSALRV